MKNKDLKEMLNMFPDDMEVIFHYHSDMCITYDNDFVVDNRELNYCSFKTAWNSKQEVYGDRMWDPYSAFVDYQLGKSIFEKIPLTKKDVIVLEVVCK